MSCRRIHITCRVFQHRCFCAGHPERVNPIHIQMISKSLHDQIFPGAKTNTEMHEEKRRMVEEHLKQHSLLDKSTDVRPEVDFKLPQLKGKSIADHIGIITRGYVKSYVQMADKLAQCVLPKPPTEWRKCRGWTRYDPDGTATSVPFPNDAAMVFDVETLVNGNYPIMATAVSPNAWYSWCSDRLINDYFIYSIRGPKLKDLIPMESEEGVTPDKITWTPRLLIGHNVSYDRSYIKEQYYLKGSKMRFLDTMSMHISMSGFTSFQRLLYNASKSSSGKTMEEIKSKKAAGKRRQPNKHDQDDDWINSGTLNNLNDVYKYHCDGEQLSKEDRDVFIKGTVKEINAKFQELMTYCSTDVAATHAIHAELWKDFRDHFKSPVTIAGMLELSTAYLPVNSSWNRYMDISDQYYFSTQDEISHSLSVMAAQACREHDAGETYKVDPWLFDLDWSTPQIKLLKAPRENAKKCDDPNLHPVVKKVLETSSRLPKKMPHMPGVPRWYSQLYPKWGSEDWTPGASLLSTSRRVTPKLLKLTWDGYPLYHHPTYGWGYIVPFKEVVDPETLDLGSEPVFPYWIARDMVYKGPPTERISKKLSGDADFKVIDDNLQQQSLTYKESDALWRKARVMTPKTEKLFFSVKHEKDGTVVPNWHQGVGPMTKVKVPGGWFFKLPHKNGSPYNVGNPLSKDFMSHIEDGTLSSAAGTDATKVLSLSKQISYWKNNRDRIRDQMVMWLNHDSLPDEIKRDNSYHTDGKYGAILPRIVVAGTITRRAVERTWLTASNAKADRIGSELKSMIQSPPGYHFVGADVDSQELWIASLFGDAHFAGMHGCTALGWMTLQGKKSEGTDLHSKTASLIGISRDEAKIFNYGRIYGAGKDFAEKLLMQFDHRLTASEAKQKADIMYKATKGTKKVPQTKDQNGRGKKVKMNTTARRTWMGGSESEMFNWLERVAGSAKPRTPVLGCRITSALQRENVKDGFMTSRINWVVQSSAVDYLHLILVCMRWLFDEFNIDGRFCISIHDEVRYLVKSEDRYRAALALHITNLYVRAMFSYKLGIDDLPLSVAFFSGVDIDRCLRKEVDMDCRTPSNSHGMLSSYLIPPGESLDIHEVLKKTGGSLEKRS